MAMSQKKLKQLASQGAKIYKGLQQKLLSKHKGKIIAIEPQSGQYFVGTDELKVALKAMKAFPKSVFSVFRIGHPAVHKFKKHHDYSTR